jgi:hypothetical protein
MRAHADDRRITVRIRRMADDDDRLDAEAVREDQSSMAGRRQGGEVVPDTSVAISRSVCPSAASRSGELHAARSVNASDCDL